MKTETWQKTADALTPESFRKTIRRQRFMQILEYILRGGIALGGAVLLIYLFVQLSERSFGNILMYSLAAIVAGIMLVDAFQKRGAAGRLYKKYGGPEDIVAELRRGAEHIELESKTFVMTDAYIIDKYDYTVYVPYAAISEYDLKFSTLGNILSSSPPDGLITIKDSSGETMIFSLNAGETGRMGEVRSILMKYAPKKIR